MTLWLQGDLGAGKTTLVRGLLRELGFAGRVKSPTYTLVEPYVVSGLYLYHFDLYRFIDPEEWHAAGFRDYFNLQSVCLIEWPAQGADLVPQPDVEIRLQAVGDGREAILSATTEAGKRCIERFSR